MRSIEIELTNLVEIQLAEERHENTPQVPHLQDRFNYLDEVRRSWLQRPEPNVGRFSIRRAFRLAMCVVMVLCIIAVPLSITMALPKHKAAPLVPDNYTVALQKALLFFNAQKSGRLPKSNGIPWRGNSGLEDGKDLNGGLVGGYYDSGINIKYHFPMSFALSMLSWSVLEYEHKFRSTAEYDHVRDLIKWGTDYILLTFDSNSSSIDNVYGQVGWRGDGSGEENDEKCWERPEDVDYLRPIQIAHTAPDLAGEMTAALAAASIVFNDDDAYSTRLVTAARTLFAFAWDSGRRVPYSSYVTNAYYNSSGFWDEHVWGATWLYYATGDLDYLSLATDPQLANKAEAATPIPNLRVLSWDNKLPAAMMLLTRVRLLLSPGYRYEIEEVLLRYRKAIDRTMCSYLQQFPVFNYTRGGLIQLNHGDVQPLQYTVDTAFLGSLYADYLKSADEPGWFCGDSFFPRDTLKTFASSQMEYILGANPMNMSYVVGYGAKFPRHVHHRGASIPKDGVKHSCTGGLKWRDNPSPNPNVINGAMAGAVNNLDKFLDVRSNYTYTEPTMAGNAGLVAALASLTSTGGSMVDKNNIFSSIPRF